MDGGESALHHLVSPSIGSTILGLHTKVRDFLHPQQGEGFGGIRLMLECPHGPGNSEVMGVG